MYWYGQIQAQVISPLISRELCHFYYWLPTGYACGLVPSLWDMTHSLLLPLWNSLWWQSGPSLTTPLSQARHELCGIQMQDHGIPTLCSRGDIQELRLRILHYWFTARYLQFRRAIFGRCFHGRHTQLCHLRDICIKEIFSPWLLSVMSSKDFKLGLIVINKFKFSQGSLKNAKHRFTERFCFIPPPNVYGFLSYNTLFEQAWQELSNDV